MDATTTTPRAPLTQTQARALNAVHTAHENLVRAQAEVIKDVNAVVDGFTTGRRSDPYGSRWTDFTTAQVKLNMLLDLASTWFVDGMQADVDRALSTEDVWFREGE